MNLASAVQIVERHRTGILQKSGSSWENYIKTHQNSPETEKNAGHRALEEMVARNPERFGLPYSAELYREIGLYAVPNQLLTILDLAAICDNDLYLIELKTSHEKHSRANRPLRIGRIFFHEIFNISPGLILIYPAADGTYQSHRINPEF